MTFCILKVLIRRAQVPDELPGAYKVNAGQDIMISVYNIHHSSEVLLDAFLLEKVLFYGLNEACLLPNLYTFKLTILI